MSIEKVPEGFLRVATAQYHPELLEDWPAFERKMDRWISEAAHRGARLLVFPEYASMELASLFGAETTESLPLQLGALQGLLHRYLHLFEVFARRYALHILAGSFPVLDEGGHRNRAYLVGPDGVIGHQDKLQMTRFETEEWIIEAGTGLQVFDTPVGVLGVAICYDAEFPLIARALAEAGVQILLVPSCTDTAAGFNRVRIGARARALENQCYVVQSSLVGEAPWSAAIDVNTGAAAVYGPVDRGFPDDGVIVQGKTDEARWVFADIALAAIDTVRSEGQVLNHRDWARSAGELPVRTIRARD